jgi:hypothetical protein
VVTGTAGPLLEVGLTTVFPSVAGFPLYTYLHPGTAASPPLPILDPLPPRHHLGKIPVRSTTKSAVARTGCQSHEIALCDPDGFGIPYWIMWVYACGAPANGNLSRLYLRVFADDRVGDDS